MDSICRETLRNSEIVLLEIWKKKIITQISWFLIKINKKYLIGRTRQLRNAYAASKYNMGLLSSIIRCRDYCNGSSDNRAKH